MSVSSVSTSRPPPPPPPQKPQALHTKTNAPHEGSDRATTARSSDNSARGRNVDISV
ncbi:MAG: hypothetical protein ACAH83_03005 [Alphaproteobacteria bacterium]